jgi:trehalose-phosphatase
MAPAYAFEKDNGIWPIINHRLLNTKRIVLFLDYDGTLSEIQPTPELAILSTRMKMLLQKMVDNKNISLIIVTGRSYKDIYNLVLLSDITYISNHGFLITYKEDSWVHPCVGDKLLFFPEIVKALKANLIDYKGILVEDKGFTISIHYRNANIDDLVIIKDKIDNIINSYKGSIILTEGKKVFELRPLIKWNKGSAVLEWLCKNQTIIDNPPLIISIGDDQTDEDMFIALNNIGITIKVGANIPTKAKFYLQNNNEVYRFLFQLNEYSNRIR